MQVALNLHFAMTPQTLRKTLDAMPVGREGNRLRVALALKGERQNVLAEAIGLAPASVSLIVSGRNNPTLETAHAIASFLGVPIETLFPSEVSRVA
jgi:transcriptional regulator with XRE-family HTH domain